MLVGEVHRDHLEPFFAILRDLVTAPRFDPADFARNRDFLTNGLVSSLRGGNDEELGKEALNALLYAGHPYEAPVLGTEEGLAAITLDDVRAFHRVALHAGPGARRHRRRLPGRLRRARRARAPRPAAGGRGGPRGAPRAPDARRRRAAAGRQGRHRDRHLHRLPDRRHPRRRRLLRPAGRQLLFRRAPHVQRPADEQDARPAGPELRRLLLRGELHPGRRVAAADPEHPEEPAVLQHLDPACPAPQRALRPAPGDPRAARPWSTRG